MPWKIDDKKKLWDAIKQVCRDDWKPKEHQKDLFESVFLKDLMYVQEEWARGGGKTSCVLKIAFIACQLFPGKLVLFVAPTKDLGKKIVRNKWSEFPHHLMDRTKNRASEGLFRFNNGSYLEIIGSEENSIRGLEPILMIYDEYAWHNSRAHLSLLPSLRKEGKLLITSTPPHLNDIETGKAKHYEEMVEFCRSDKTASFHQVTVEKIIQAGMFTQEFLDTVERDYTNRGEHDEFMKEYWLKRIYRSQDSYFYDINDSILIPTANMVKLVEDVKHPTWCVFGDTSGSSRWGALFACIDENNNIAYLVDSLVRERKGKNTSDNRDASDLTPSRFWPLIQHKIQKWTPTQNESTWEIRWDFDTTFMDVIPLMFGSHIIIDPVDKKYDKKKETFSIIRDLIKTNRLYISEHCADLIKEMRLLAVDAKTGEFVKRNDELTDCLRYMVMAYDSCFESNIEPIKPKYTGNYLEYIADLHWKGIMKDDRDETQVIEDFLKGRSYL